MKSDVLISHSHNDLSIANKLANKLESIGIEVFLDGEYWGSCDEFLQKVDDTHCMNEDRTSYSYRKRNFSTSVMHMLLATALAHVIQKTECVFFLNTRNTILSDEYGAMEQTGSPWIYHELWMTRLLAPSERDMSRRKYKGEKKIVASKRQVILEGLQASLPVPLEHLEQLSMRDFWKWCEFCQYNYKAGDALDMLYGKGYDN